MFERFTERARQVVVLAQDSARRLDHGYIGTEHLLLGLLREEEGVAARVLESLGVTDEGATEKIVAIVGMGDGAVQGQIPFTPRAKRVLELSLREALAIGHNYIGTEHILLGLVRENEGIASRVLLEFDAGAEKIRDEIIGMLAGPGRGRQGQLRPLPLTAGDDTAMRSVLRALLDLVGSARRAAEDRHNVHRAATLGLISASLEQIATQIEALPALGEDDPAPPERG